LRTANFYPLIRKGGENYSKLQFGEDDEQGRREWGGSRLYGFLSGPIQKEPKRKKEARMCYELQMVGRRHEFLLRHSKTNGGKRKRLGFECRKRQIGGAG